MINVFGVEFKHKICRSCGQSFYGELDICSDCQNKFTELGDMLKSHEYKNHLRFCKYCGRPFIGGNVVKRKNFVYFQPTTSVYCKGEDDKLFHYSQCQNCGGPIKVKLDGGWPKKVGCSRKCTSAIQKEKLRLTSLERYGTDNPMQSEQIQEKTRNTCRERYGVDHVLQAGAMRDRIDAAMREKFNVESNVSQNPEVRAKITKTVTEKYGGYTWQSEKLIQKCKETSLRRYGTEYPNQSEEVKQKIVEGTRKHYGVDYVMQSEEFKAELNANCMKKYGVMWPGQTPQAIEATKQSNILRYANTIEDPIKRQNYLDFTEDPIAYIKNSFESKPTLNEVQESIGGLDSSTIYSYIGTGTAFEVFTRKETNMEKEVHNFLLSILPNSDIINNTRKIIAPKEIDIYLPEYRIGFECNPTSTHNSSVPCITTDNENILPANYHKMKTDLSDSAGIFLFHVFGYEWNHKKEIIQSMIKNLLGKSDIKYHARNLILDSAVDYYEVQSFLTKNHRQGRLNASVCLGLRTKEGELVSLMTFNKIRNTIGSKQADTEDTWELSRFCNKLNTNIVGGASKLFKYFTDNYKFDKIISFSDRSHTRGSLYGILGFEQKNISEPNYVWVDYKTDVAYNRVTCQKKNLPKLLNESDLDIENQTEKQIMMTHGFVQVFDSGTIRWEYCR